jgi:hypothetical protein
MKKSDWMWIGLYAIYVALIFGLAGFYGTKHKNYPTTIDKMPTIQEIAPAKIITTVKHKQKAAVKSTAQEQLIEEYEADKAEFLNGIEPVVPTPEPQIVEQQSKVIVAMAKEVLQLKEDVKALTAEVKALKDATICNSKLTTSWEERELMETNAIAHTYYVSQHLWEKLDAGCR